MDYISIGLVVFTVVKGQESDTVCHKGGVNSMRCEHKTILLEQLQLSWETQGDRSGRGGVR